MHTGTPYSLMAYGKLQHTQESLRHQCKRSKRTFAFNKMNTSSLGDLCTTMCDFCRMSSIDERLNEGLLNEIA